MVDTLGGFAIGIVTLAIGGIIVTIGYEYMKSQRDNNNWEERAKYRLQTGGTRRIKKTKSKTKRL